MPWPPAAVLGVWLGALIAGVGLLAFAPLLGLAPRAGRLRWLIEIASRPFGEWDLVASASLHRFLPLASAIPVVALTGLLFGVKRARPWLGGFALGMGAYVAQLALSGEVATAYPAMAARVFLAANVLVCAWVARIALDRKPS